MFGSTGAPSTGTSRRCDFYEQLGATRLDEWRTFRLDRPGYAASANRSVLVRRSYNKIPLGLTKSSE